MDVNLPSQVRAHVGVSLMRFLVYLDRMLLLMGGGSLKGIFPRSHLLLTQISLMVRLLHALSMGPSMEFLRGEELGIQFEYQLFILDLVPGI